MNVKRPLMSELVGMVLGTAWVLGISSLSTKIDWSMMLQHRVKFNIWIILKERGRPECVSCNPWTDYFSVMSGLGLLYIHHPASKQHQTHSQNMHRELLKIEN